MAPTLFVWGLGVLLIGNCYAVGPSRIAGGKPASIQSYPSLVQVESRNALTNVWIQSCGGTIITSHWVLSAAHCFDGWSATSENLRIRAGTSIRHTGGQVREVRRVVNHPNYDGSESYDSDISMIELLDPLIYNPAVQQGVLLLTGTALPDNTPVQVVGWGLVSEGSLASNELQEATAFTTSTQTCRDYYMSLPTPGIITDNMICSGLSPDSGNACLGDYGGPVYYQDIVVGVSSFGNACSNNDHYPGVSTAVQVYVNWIMSVVQTNHQNMSLIKIKKVY